MGTGDDCIASTLNNIPTGSTLENCVTHTITVNPNPMVMPSAVSTNLCYEEDINLIDSANDGNVSSWSWIGPNGFTSSSQNPVIPFQLFGPGSNVTTNPFYPGIGTHVYNLTVTNVYGCTSTSSVSIVINPLPELMSCTSIDPLCFGEESGEINITISGGTLPFSFLWTRVAQGTTYNTEDLINVGAGMYTLTVTDANGCSLYLEKELFNPEPLEIIPDMVWNPACPGSCDGMISFMPLGGTAPYSYSWSDLTGPMQPLERNDLCAGTHTLTVTDANGCEDSFTITMSNPAPLETNAGPDAMVCSISPYTHAADPAPPGSVGTWTHNGTGSLTDINDPNAVYTPGAGDLGNNVVFTWSYPAPFGNCPAMDNMTLLVKDSGCGGFPWNGSMLNND